MITVPTALILGAGASADYRFPVGNDFRNQFCELLFDEEFFREIDEHGLANVGEVS